MDLGRALVKLVDWSPLACDLHSLERVIYIALLITYMKKLLDSNRLRTVQFVLNTVQTRGNWMQARILIGQWAKKFTDSQSNLLFSNHARALDGQLWRNFFPDCVIINHLSGWARAQNWEESSESVKFKTSFTQVFSCLYYW